MYLAVVLDAAEIKLEMLDNMNDNILYHALVD